MGADRLRRPSSPTDGLKPIADGIRRVPPFGSPKGEGQRDQTRRNTGGDARSQLDPPHGGTGARAHRQARWRDRSPLRLRGYMDGPASLATIPPLAALREARLNRLPGALAVVRRHCIGGSRRRVSDTSPTGLSDATKVGEPAYSLGPHSVRPLRRLAGGCAPSDPTTATARRERWTRRVGEGPGERRGACRVARLSALGGLDAVGSGRRRPQGGCRGGRGRRPPGRHGESTLRARRPAGADATRRHMADGSPRGSPLPMICAPPAPWVMAVYACEIDKGCRCAPRRPGRAHRRGDGGCCAQRS